MSADPKIRERLARAADPLPVDVEAGLAELHTKGEARATRRRVAALAVAAVIAVGAVAVAWALLPRGTSPQPAAPTEPAGMIVYTVVDSSRAEADSSAYSIVLPDGAPMKLVSGNGTSFPLPVRYSPDGAWVAFTQEGSGTGSDLIVMRPDGSERRAVVSGVGGTALAWSPDGTRLAFFELTGGESRLATVALDGSDLRELEPGSWESIDWSPDGTTLVAGGFPTGDTGNDTVSPYDIWLVPVDGSAPTRLTDDPSRETWPRFSPDGTTVAYMRDEMASGTEYAYDVMTIPATGGAPTQLTSWEGADVAPVWSVDGQWIAFGSDRDATDAQQRSNRDGRSVLAGASLYVMRADGSDARLVQRTDALIVPSDWTSATGSHLATEAPSQPSLPEPTGTIAIAVGSITDGGGEAFDIRTHDVTGTSADEQLLTASPDALVRWSPDGTRLAHTDGDGSIVVANADGSDPRAYPTTPYRLTAWTWAPDGTRIAFVSLAPQLGSGDVSILDLASGGVTPVRGLAGNWGSLDWSPDGTTFALSGAPADGTGAQPSRMNGLWLAGVDGSGLTQIVEDATAVYPRWSPDGTQIAFAMVPQTAQETYLTDIVVANADGTGLTTLTSWKGWNQFPVWSPDGQWIAYASDKDASPEQLAINSSHNPDPFGGLGIYLMRADGSDVRTLAPSADGLVQLAADWTAGPMPATGDAP